MLADEDRYVASESSFYRVLHEANLMAHRIPARPSAHRKPEALVATGPRQVWSWDITYLRAPRRGTFFMHYLVLDVWSRKIVGWKVHEEESAELSSKLIAQARAAERVARGALSLHSDNGGPMKGATFAGSAGRGSGRPILRRRESSYAVDAAATPLWRGDVPFRAPRGHASLLSTRTAVRRTVARTRW